MLYAINYHALAMLMRVVGVEIPKWLLDGGVPKTTEGTQLDILVHQELEEAAGALDTERVRVRNNSFRLRSEKYLTSSLSPLPPLPLPKRLPILRGQNQNPSSSHPPGQEEECLHQVSQISSKRWEHRVDGRHLAPGDGLHEGQPGVRPLLCRGCDAEVLEQGGRSLLGVSRRYGSSKTAWTIRAGGADLRTRVCQQYVGPVPRAGAVRFRRRGL